MPLNNYSITDTAAFLDCLFEDIEPAVIEVRLIEDRRGAPPPEREWFDHPADVIAELPRILNYAERGGRAVYFGVLPRREYGTGKGADAAPGWAAWVDLDFKDVAESTARERIAHLEHAPSIVVHSGRGLHLYWLQKEATDPAILSSLSCRLAAALGGDHCYDAARILRLPGTRNLKHCWNEGVYTPSDSGPVCTIESSNAALRHSPDDFDDLPEVDTTKIEAPQRPRATKEVSATLSGRVVHLLATRPRIAALRRGEGKTSGDVSGSGYDFSYAIALAWAGVSDPDELDAAIAERPNGGKPRTRRAIRRCADRALAIVESRLPSEPPKPARDEAPPHEDDDAPRWAGADPEGPPNVEDAPGDADVPLRERHAADVDAARTTIRAAMLALGAEQTTKPERDAVARQLAEVVPALAWLAALEPPEWAGVVNTLAASGGFTGHAARLDRTVRVFAVPFVGEVRDEERRNHPVDLTDKPEGADHAVWRKLVKRFDPQKGRYYPTPIYANVYRILRDDPHYGVCLRRNEMNGSIFQNNDEVSEGAGVAEIVLWISEAYRLGAMAEPVRAAIVAVAEANAFHPVREYLQMLPTWDGVPRIATLLTVVLDWKSDADVDLEWRGARNIDEARARQAQLYQRYLRRMLISAVARAMRPGCKVDTALILVGGQGLRKSTFFATLFGPWFGDSDIELGKNVKDAYMKLRYVWAYEVAELETLSKSEAGEIKRFLSSAFDLYRAPYDRQPKQWPRHSICAGSTNRDGFLDDDTGSRRFWPIHLAPDARIDIPRLAEMRDPLWGEALAAYRIADVAIQAGTLPDAESRWWFEPDEDADRALDADQFTIVDSREELVMVWVRGKEDGSFTTLDVLMGPLGIEAGRVTQRDEQTVRKILRRNDWECKKLRWYGGPPVWRWRRKPRSGPVKNRDAPNSRRPFQNDVPIDVDGVPV